MLDSDRHLSSFGLVRRELHQTQINAMFNPYMFLHFLVSLVSLFFFQTYLLSID